MYNLYLTNVRLQSEKHCLNSPLIQQDLLLATERMSAVSMPYEEASTMN